MQSRSVTSYVCSGVFAHIKAKAHANAAEQFAKTSQLVLSQGVHRIIVVCLLKDAPAFFNQPVTYGFLQLQLCIALDLNISIGSRALSRAILSKVRFTCRRRVWMSNTITPTVFYRTLNVEGLEIFYREAGPRDGPTVLLLHGFPSSSHMFRNLIPVLADKYHVVAPDFPGYGESSAPSVNDFEYSFERFATVTEQFTENLKLSSYALYLSDIGASVGFHLAVMHPERVTAMIVQNGDAHVEAINKDFLKTGLLDYWEDPSEKNAQVLLDWLLTMEGTKWHYLHGVRDPSRISPDNWVIDQANQDRPGNKDIQLSILYNAKRNLDAYPDWQEYFRRQRPPMLITWGKNDGIFTIEGAELYKRELPNAELHILDTGHFALEEEVDRIGSLMHEFLDRTINEK